ncbi:hypothetical protein [Tellurirhabdus rosea]|uniref:hypothetical protein n=1 Tax=Tellurirhabdus rosea TaxID=2674997 RepID=UPI002251EC9C|nr:hypothetical protein [Tellurirhabdus rosea]
MKLAHKLAFLTVLLSASQPLLAQTETVAALQKAFESHQTRSLTEKLFVHTDRSTYLTGELMAFRMFCVDGRQHRPLDMSKVAYLEVMDKDKKPVLQTKIRLSQGSGHGALFLPASLASGHYLVRAYTNWMKNTGPDYFFEKTITLVNPFRQLGLPPRRDSVAYDVQFFPEGGHLVAGLSSKVAFRMTDVTGKGTSLPGFVLNQQNDTVARFSPARAGIGTFTFTPEPGQTYRAVVRDARRGIFAAPFPAVQGSGYAMQVSETGGRLSVQVQTRTPASNAVYLLVHTRQSLKTVLYQPLVNEAARFDLDLNSLGEGISHLTLFDGQRQPVCERLFFRPPAQPLPVKLQTDQPQYATRSRVSLGVSTARPADLSVSVYRLDSLQETEKGSILAYLWLASDLRGTVESPEYYFGENTPERKEASDNLMLTHGWRRFRWENVLRPAPASPEFLPEINGHLVTGQVQDPATGAGVPSVEAVLSVVGKPTRLYGARSDNRGRLLFELTDFYGPHELVAATLPKDSLFRADILSPFAETPSATPLPRFDLSPAREAELVTRSVAMQVQNAYHRERLAPFRIPAVDSLPFFGTADERYRLDDYTRFTTMEDVFREYVPGIQARKRREGYRLQVLNLPYKMFFETTPLVLVDGVPTFDMDKLMAVSPLKMQRLEVVTRQYFLGPLVFSGIANFSTYKGDLAGFRLDPRISQLDYEGLQWPREYYAPKYDTPERQRSRLPDLRNQLFWAPEVRTDSTGRASLDFYTSDQTGRYLIIANGLSASGEAGQAATTIDVINVVK